MQIIKAVYIKDSARYQYYIYEGFSKWALKRVFYMQPKEDISLLLSRQGLEPDIILIELNAYHRYWFYELYPGSQMAVMPHALFNWVQERWPYASVYEEVAISAERKGFKECLGMWRFLKDFYALQTKEEAILFYEKFQLEMPVNSCSYMKLIGVMEYYLKEIMNYFTIKKALFEGYKKDKN